MTKSEIAERMFLKDLKILVAHRRRLQLRLAQGDYEGVSINAKFCKASDHLLRVRARDTFE